MLVLCLQLMMRVWKILAAGEWRSPAFLDYLDVHRMEIEMVLHGHLDEESDCDEAL